MEISWTNKKIYHSNSSISGKGVFAVGLIKKGELVAIFGGYSVDMKDLKKLSKKDPRTYNTILEIGYQVHDEVVFAPTSAQQFSTIEYLNHSCAANCGFEGPIHLIALREIKKGEEITMDYGTCITNKLFEMKCSCGSTECRHKVTANDWRNTVVQKRYKSHFQPFILEKIKALRRK